MFAHLIPNAFTRPTLLLARLYSLTRQVLQDHCATPAPHAESSWKHAPGTTARWFTAEILRFSMESNIPGNGSLKAPIFFHPHSGLSSPKCALLPYFLHSPSQPNPDPQHPRETQGFLSHLRAFRSLLHSAKPLIFLKCVTYQSSNLKQPPRASMCKSITFGFPSKPSMT